MSTTSSCQDTCYEFKNAKYHYLGLHAMSIHAQYIGRRSAFRRHLQNRQHELKWMLLMKSTIGSDDIPSISTYVKTMPLHHRRLEES